MEVRDIQKSTPAVNARRMMPILSMRLRVMASIVLYTLSMKSFRRAFGMFAVVVLLVSGFFIFSSDPEEREVVSEDGVVTITGLTRTSQNFSVEVDRAAMVGDPLRGAVYQVGPEHMVVDAPVILSFAKQENSGTHDATAVYQWNASLGMWEIVHAVVANTRDVLAVQVTSLGSFALGVVPKVDAPIMLASYDALHAKAPTGARGYHIAVAYRVPHGVFARLPNAGEIGGCNGRVGAGDRTEYSSTSATMNVMVNDVLTPVEFSMVSEWAVSGDGTGCADGAAMRVQE
jgi:hypothetical protein